MERRRLKMIAAASFAFLWALPVFAAQNCVSTKDTEYVYSGTTTSQLDSTIENATTTCDTLIDEAASNTLEYQAQRANDINDRDAAYCVLGICLIVFVGAAFYRNKNK